MRQAPRCEPPFDPRWLDLLVERCHDLRGGGSRFEDFYLEQRLELRAVMTSGELHFEECRLEGAAARWRSPSRSVLHARTGLSTTAFSELLARHADRVAMPSGRTVPTPEMDPPRGWIDWARSVTLRIAPAPVVVRYLNRRAAVVRADGWAPVSTPALVRVERLGDQSSALLAVWGHPRLGSWLGELMADPPTKAWEPNPGAQFPVLFMNGTAGILMHELVGHMAESDLVASGASPLAQLAGATITAPTVRIIDDPTRFDLPGAFDHDDEAVPAEPIPVVTSADLKDFFVMVKVRVSSSLRPDGDAALCGAVPRLHDCQTW